jgi:Na+/H+-dicarboxylate symporter
MYPLLLTLHNWARWLVVIFGAYALVRAYVGFFGRRAWTPADKTAGTLFSISVDVQFLIGLILSIVSPLVAAALTAPAAAMQSNELRRILMEHIPLMVLAVVFVHLGSMGARRAADDRGRFRRSVIWFTLTVLVLLAAIPWWRPLLRLP